MSQDPDILVLLTSTRTEFEAQTIAEALRAHGIPAQAFGTAAATAQWELGIRSEFQVMVRRRDLDEAGSVLRAIKADSVDIDWEEVDVGADESPDTPPPLELGPKQPASPWLRRVGWAVFIGAMLLVFWELAIVAFGAALLWEYWAWSRRPEPAAPPAV